MNHGSLFSGIGGFDLAAQWMGWDNIFHCEWNEFGQKVLKHYWPKSITYDDITKTDFTIHRGRIDILSGGFPCQPYSQAGKRLGKEDDRHLWPEMLRAIREIKPSYVVGENVLGLTNWNGGLVFEEVQSDLEAEGYEAQPVLLPASGVGAPHQRQRVWFIAYSDGAKQSDRRRENHKEKREVRRYEKSDVLRELSSVGNATDTKSESSRGQLQQRQEQGKHRGCNSEGNVADTSSQRGGKDVRGGDREPNELNEISPPGDWQNFPTQSPVCTRNDGISSRLDGITFPKWRNESIKAAGNAIVPQVAHQIFKTIEALERKD